MNEMLHNNIFNLLFVCQLLSNIYVELEQMI